MLMSIPCGLENRSEESRSVQIIITAASMWLQHRLFGCSGFCHLKRDFDEISEESLKQFMWISMKNSNKEGETDEIGAQKDTG